MAFGVVVPAKWTVLNVVVRLAAGSDAGSRFTETTGLTLVDDTQVFPGDLDVRGR